MTSPNSSSISVPHSIGTFQPGQYQQQREQPAASSNRVKDIITTTQHTFEKLKKDLNERDAVIEDKNREILRLKVQNEDLASRISLNARMQANQSGIQLAGMNQMSFGAMNSEQRRQLIVDLAYLVDTLRSEIVKIK